MLYNTWQQAFRYLVVSFTSFCRNIIIILSVWNIGYPNATGYAAHPPGPPPPNYPVGHSFHPVSQPGVSVQPPQSMATAFQMFGKVILCHSTVNLHVSVSVCAYRLSWWWWLYSPSPWSPSSLWTQSATFQAYWCTNSNDGYKYYCTCTHNITCMHVPGHICASMHVIMYLHV
jgi:hypothetical protein